LAPAAAFAGPGAFGRVGQEVVQRAQKEAAEAAPPRVGPAQGGFLQQVHKEVLGEVLGVGPAVAAPANERVDRVAIGAVKGLEGRFGLPGAFLRSGRHQPPLRGQEMGLAPSRGI
jgi:hypothetical protein